MSIVVKGAPVVVMGKCPLDGFEGAAQLNGVLHHGFLRLLLNSIEHIHETIEGQNSPVESVEFLHDVTYPHILGRVHTKLLACPFGDDMTAYLRLGLL